MASAGGCMRWATGTCLRSRACWIGCRALTGTKPTLMGCNEWLPRDRHVIVKGGAVNWNEGLHSKLRSKLNRLARRTKGYTKSVEMLKHLLAIVFEECLNQSLKSINPAG